MKDKFRLFELIAYIDTSSYNIDEVLKIVRSQKYYAYCLHDQDIDLDGKIKKPHYHIVLRFDNARTISGVCKLLGVPYNVFFKKGSVDYNNLVSNHDLKWLQNHQFFKQVWNKAHNQILREDEYIQIVYDYVTNIRNERSYIRYLIHFDDKDKYQYRQSDIVCSRSYERFVNKCFDDKETEDEILENIFCKINDYISSNFSYHEIIIQLVRYININAYETVYKRYRNEIKDYILTVKY